MPEDFPVDHWSGYLAAFDDLMDACKRRDPWMQEVARHRMTSFLEQSPEYWGMIARHMRAKRDKRKQQTD